MNKLLSIFLLCVFNVHAQKQEINISQLSEQISQYTGEFMEENKFIGMQTMVLYKNDIIFNEGFGYSDFENKKSFSDKTIVALGSNTKEFTSVAVQLLKNKSLIRYDDKIEKYLSNELVNKSNITIRQLLCHTSGLPDFFDIEEKYEPNVTSFNSIISTTAKLSRKFLPGEKYEYNNTGYLLLGKLIEKISNQNIGDFFREHIISPLELQDTYYLGDTFSPQNMSKSYEEIVDNKIQIFNSNSQYYAEYRISQAAGGLGGSLSDFVKWHTAILKGQLLPMESVNEMITPCTINNGSQTKYGLGMEIRTINNEVYYNHGGATNGFVSDALYFPNRDLTIGFVTNSWENPTKYKNFLIKKVLYWLDNKNGNNHH